MKDLKYILVSPDRFRRDLCGWLSVRESGGGIGGDEMNPGDLKRSKNRLAEFLAMNAPDAILRGEARILLERIEGGEQKAIIAWQHEVIRQKLTDLVTDVRLWWLARCGWSEECAESMVLCKSKKSEHPKHGCKTCAVNVEGDQ